MPADADLAALTAIPNIGPRIARKLLALDVRRLDDLRGRDPDELFERLCAMDGRRHDPCLLDTFAAAVEYADGGPSRPWWELSRERKARAAASAG
jgi:nucleotidyltransferase/DNA polymerase involved in DNA repair